MNRNRKRRISCPYCSEKIFFDAKKCRYCGEWLNKKTFKEKTKTLIPQKISSKKKVILIIIAIFLFLIFKNALSSSNKIEDKTTNSLTPDEKSLKNVAIEQYKLIASGKKEDWIRLYREFYTPDNVNKEKSEDEFVSNNVDETLKLKEKGLDHIEFEIHSVNVNGVIGYVDRTEKFCQNSDCSVDYSTPVRSIRKYIFANNKWLMTSEDVLCTRDQPYAMEPEFERALSLIFQRTTDTADGKIIKKVRNCLSIEYANSENEMDGAEGFFSFHQGQSADKLDILVSPKYKSKDDLITALLLVHEVTHAAVYSSTFGRDDVDCFESEAIAYVVQYSFVNNSLNQEEKNSLNARLRTDTTEEIKNLKYIFDGINRSSGSEYLEKATNFIKTIPDYQEQCAKNNKLNN